MTRGELADRLAPYLVAELRSRERAILDELGPWTRPALRAAWPVLLREVPHVTAALVAAFRAECGRLTVAELMDLLSEET